MLLSLSLSLSSQYNFQHEGTQNRVSREQFMMILINIESILIRATYYSDVDLAR